MIAQLAFAIVMLVAGTAEADSAVITATLDPPAFRIGETADLTVTIEGRQSTKQPVIADTAGLSIRYVGPSSRVSIVNSSISSSVTHTFQVSGTRPGRYEIGPIRVEIDGEVKDAGKVTVEIRSATAAPSPNAPQGVSQLTLTLAVPRTEVYLHERVPLALTLRIGAVRVDGLQYPNVPSEGFALESFPEPKQTRQQGPGGAEHVIEFNTWLTPLKQGPLVVGPVTMGMSMAVPRGRRGTFLGNMFGDEMKPIQVAADAVTLTVLPLPDAGRPADFSGAVGKFTMKVKVAPREVTVGDPVTVTSMVRGSGSLDGIAPPTIAGTETLRVYPVQSARSDDNDTRTFEQVVIPLREGPMTLGGPSFSAFDPDARVYRKLGSRPGRTHGSRFHEPRRSRTNRRRQRHGRRVGTAETTCVAGPRSRVHKGCARLARTRRRPPRRQPSVLAGRAHPSRTLARSVELRSTTSPLGRRHALRALHPRRSRRAQRARSCARGAQPRCARRVS